MGFPPLLFAAALFDKLLQQSGVMVVGLTYGTTHGGLRGHVGAAGTCGWLLGVMTWVNFRKVARD